MFQKLQPDTKKNQREYLWELQTEVLDTQIVKEIQKIGEKFVEWDKAIQPDQETIKNRIAKMDSRTIEEEVVQLEKEINKEQEKINEEEKEFHESSIANNQNLLFACRKGHQAKIKYLCSHMALLVEELTQRQTSPKV